MLYMRACGDELLLQKRGREETACVYTGIRPPARAHCLQAALFFRRACHHRPFPFAARVCACVRHVYNARGLASMINQAAGGVRARRAFISNEILD